VLLANFICGFPGHFPLAGFGTLCSMHEITSDKMLHLINLATVVFLLFVPFMITPTVKARFQATADVKNK